MGMTRRAAIAAVSLLSALSLAACGGSASNSSTGAASGTASPGASAGAEKATGKVTVLAAASLQGAFEEIEKTVEKDNPGLDVTFDFQGSQDLVASLAGGNSADVLATANNSTMKDAVDQKLVGDQTEFATNVLTLIVPKGNPKNVTGLDSSLDGANLVICAPEVPCGEATKKLAAALGVTLNPVSEEQKVTDVRGKVEAGEADAGQGQGGQDRHPRRRRRQPLPDRPDRHPRERLGRQGLHRRRHRQGRPGGLGQVRFRSARRL